MSDPAASLAPLTAASGPMTYEHFGVSFIRLVLDAERVCRSVDQVLGESLHLGPMAAGPGRLARLTAEANFRPTYGELLPGELLRYRVLLPLSVDFEVDLRAGRHAFHAEVLVPLVLTVHAEPPLRIVTEIQPPSPDEVEMNLAPEKRRSAALQRMAGLDEELRRFLVRVLDRELAKPHVRRATDVDVHAVIDGAWPAVAAQFLPPGPGTPEG